MVLLLHYALQNIIITEPAGAEYFRNFSQLARYIFYFFPAFVLSSYFLMYVITPAFLFRKQFIAFLFYFGTLLLADFLAALASSVLYLKNTQHLPVNAISFQQIKINLFVNGIWMPLIILSLSCGIQLTKKWILQQTDNEKLLKEKISKELKLLKTRIHPRFLFHSLNSLESKLRTGLPESPDMILKMSELLNYILFGSEGDYVPLQKELEVVREYITLQKTNHQDEIQISLAIGEVSDDSYLAPLILLPFLETAIEYLMVMDTRVKKMDVDIRVRENILYFSITCTEDFPAEAKFYQQPVWSDITRRIENLYRGNHQLILKSNTHEIIIDLRLNMVHRKSSKENVPANSKEDHEYA